MYTIQYVTAAFAVRGLRFPSMVRVCSLHYVRTATPISADTRLPLPILVNASFSLHRTNIYGDVTISSDLFAQCWANVHVKSTWRHFPACTDLLNLLLTISVFLIQLIQHRNYF